MQLCQLSLIKSVKYIMEVDMVRGFQLRIQKGGRCHEKCPSTHFCLVEVLHNVVILRGPQGLLKVS